MADESSPPTNIKPKRQVSYNPDVVLCPFCTKRIRLNNSGHLRVHVVGKIGSAKCEGSDTKPAGGLLTTSPVSNGDPKLMQPELFEKPEEPGATNLFSDAG